MTGTPRAATDAALVARFADGSQESFAELVARHWPLVFQVGRRVTRNHSDAEEIAQATFLALSDAVRAGRHREIANMIGWLHRVATHLACHRRDANRARERHEAQAALSRELRTAESGATRAEAATQAIDQALERIPERYRAALVRHYLRGESIAEIASACATTDGTVASWLSRGRKLLQAQLPAGGVASVALGALALQGREAVAPPPPEALQALGGGDGPTAEVRALASIARGLGSRASVKALVACAVALAAALALLAWRWTREAVPTAAPVAIPVAAIAPPPGADRALLPLSTVSVEGGIDPAHAPAVEAVIQDLPGLAVGGVPASCLADQARFGAASLEDAFMLRSGVDASQLDITRFVRSWILGRDRVPALSADAPAMALVAMRAEPGQCVGIDRITRRGHQIDITLGIGHAVAGSAEAVAPAHVTAIVCWLGRLDPGRWTVQASCADIHAPALHPLPLQVSIAVPARGQPPADMVSAAARHGSPPEQVTPPLAGSWAWCAQAYDRVDASEAAAIHPGLVAAGALTPQIQALLLLGHPEVPGMLPMSLPERSPEPCDAAVLIAGSMQTCASLLCLDGPVRFPGPTQVEVHIREWIDPSVPKPAHRALLVLSLPMAAHPLQIRLHASQLRRLGAGAEFATVEQPGGGRLPAGPLVLGGEAWAASLQLP